MNFVLLEKYLKAYKENFQYVNRNEIYKWQVVKVFKITGILMQWIFRDAGSFLDRNR